MNAFLAVVIGLAAVWIVLRIFGFTQRVAFYRVASTAGERFLSPGWIIALAAAAVLLFFLRREPRRAVPADAIVAPEVHIRAEPAGKTTIVIGGSYGAMARDYTLTRDIGREERILSAFDLLARRVAASDAGRAGRAADREEIDETQRQVYALGLEIGSELLGPKGAAADAIADLPGDHLQLGVQPELSGIPWELAVARPGGLFLWQLFAVSRQLRDTSGPAAGARPATLPLRMLLLANLEAGVPGRGLPHAEDEAAEILELAASAPDLLRVVRKSPRSGDELSQLLRQGYDLMHFAGHASEPDVLRGGWVMAGGTVVDPSEAVREAASAPILVFANTCSSSPGSRSEGSADAARSLMRAGTGAYLSTLWQLHDAGSAAFGCAFYRSLISGSTLGGALTAARTALLGAHPMTWANYVLYGNPALRPIPPRSTSTKKTTR